MANIEPKEEEDIELEDEMKVRNLSIISFCAA